jgi:hypothetical protein
VENSELFFDLLIFSFKMLSPLIKWQASPWDVFLLSSGALRAARVRLVAIKVVDFTLMTMTVPREKVFLLPVVERGTPPTPRVFRTDLCWWACRGCESGRQDVGDFDLKSSKILGRCLTWKLDVDKWAF